MKKLVQKTIVIVGPTASGKSDLAIALAKKYGGEVISADSRQVYRGMNIGTGKVLRDKFTKHSQSTEESSKNMYFSEGIRHHLIDVASPKRTYNVTHFIRDTKKAITHIRKRGKVPIICGGTGFWIQSFIDGGGFPLVKPDVKLRTKLGKLSAEELFDVLRKQDPKRAETIDKKNKVRLIRALEIISVLGKVPPVPTIRNSKFEIRNSFLIIALCPPQEILHKNIAVRLEKRLKQGMVTEVETLRAEGISWKRLESFGLEYKYVALFLQKK
ncbi:MAG: tRNA (adenosine(37)-N6)-dimethylallyltransferase MiaA, partial [Candidatus Moranbacteria bacterium CG2_30_45_14]